MFYPETEVINFTAIRTDTDRLIGVVNTLIEARDKIGTLLTMAAFRFLIGPHTVAHFRGIVTMAWIDISVQLS